MSSQVPVIQTPEIRDMITFAEFGRALWADPAHSNTIAVETLSAISLLDLTQERAIEKASAALLDRALRQGMASSTAGALEAGAFGPLFRLSPEQRFILVALHLGKWSYARVARVMGSDRESIEAQAWKARTQIAASKGLAAIGAKIATSNCPEYNLDRPWTQRFLDEEMGVGREAVFLQNHLMGCDSCQRALTRCRDIYFLVEGMLPRVSEDDRVVRVLEKVSHEGKKLRSPDRVTFGDSLVAFLNQRNVQVFIAVIVFAILVIGLKK